MKEKLFPYAVLLVVCYGVFVAADDLTVVSTVLTSILYDLEIPVTELDKAAWIVTSYLLGYVVTMPLLGRLSDLFGRQRAYVLSMGFFVLGSFFCARAPAFGPLIGARVVTAFGGGAVVPIAMALAGDLGMEIDLSAVIAEPGDLRTDRILYSESQGRILVSVSPANEEAFLSLFEGLPCRLVGRTHEDALLRVSGKDGGLYMEESLPGLREAYKKTLWW